MEEDDIQFAHLSPAVREDVREVLAGTASVAVAAQLASEPSAPAEALDVLSTFPDPQVRALVARHPNLAGTTREKMVTNRIEGDEWARATLASRPDLSDDALKILLSDPSPRVRQFAIRNQGVSDEQIRAVLNNANEDKAVVQEAQKVAKERGIGHIDPQEVLDMTDKIKIVSDRMVAVAKAVEEGWMSPEWAVAEHALLSVEMAELTKQSIQLGASAATRDPQVAEDAHKKIQEAGVNALESELDAAQEALNSGDSNTAELFDNVERRVQQLKDLNVTLPPHLQARVDAALSQSREQATFATQVAAFRQAQERLVEDAHNVSVDALYAVRRGESPSAARSELENLKKQLEESGVVLPPDLQARFDAASMGLRTAELTAQMPPTPSTPAPQVAVSEPEVAPTTATPAPPTGPTPSTSWSPQAQAALNTMLNVVPDRAKKLLDEAQKGNLTTAQWAALNDEWDELLNDWRGARSTLNRSGVIPTTAIGDAVAAARDSYDSASREFSELYDAFIDRETAKARAARDAARTTQTSPAQDPPENSEPQVVKDETENVPPQTPSARGTDEGEALFVLENVAENVAQIANKAQIAASAAVVPPQQRWEAVDKTLANLDQQWEAAFDVLAAADEATKKQNFPTLSEFAKKRSEAKALYAESRSRAATRLQQTTPEQQPSEQPSEQPSAPSVAPMSEERAVARLGTVAADMETLAARAWEVATGKRTPSWDVDDRVMEVLNTQWDEAYAAVPNAARGSSEVAAATRKRRGAKELYDDMRGPVEQKQEPTLSGAEHNPFAPSTEPDAPAPEQPTPAQEVPEEKSGKANDTSSLFVAQQLLRSKKLSDKAPLYKALLGFEESEKAIPLADCLHNMVSSEAAAEYLFDVMSPAQREAVGRKIAQVNNPVLNKEWRKALLRSKRLTREEKRQLNKGNVKGAVALTAGLAIIATAGSLPTVGPLLVGGVMVAGLAKVSIPILHIVNEGVQSGQGAGHIAAELIKWAGTSGYQLAKGAMYATTTANRKLNEGVAVTAAFVTPPPVKRSIKLGANKSVKAVSKGALKGTQALGFNLDEKPEQLEDTPSPAKPKEPAYTR